MSRNKLCSLVQKTNLVEIKIGWNRVSLIGYVKFSKDIQHFWYIQMFQALLKDIGENQFTVIWQEVTGTEFVGEISDLIIRNES